MPLQCIPKCLLLPSTAIFSLAADSLFCFLSCSEHLTGNSTNLNITSAPFFLFFCRLQGSQIKQIPTKYSQTESTKFLVLTVVSILCIVGVLLASTVVYCLRHRSHHKLKEKLTNLGTDTTGDATATYQVGGATELYVTLNGKVLCLQTTLIVCYWGFGRALYHVHHIMYTYKASKCFSIH